MMDLESAIQHCEEVADTPCFTDEEARCYSEHRQLAEWLKELKAYKEQSGDAISRQAAIDALTKTSGIRGDALKALYDLPSVTPQQRTGRWIDADGDNAKCGCCNRLNHLYGDYCKYCGAKMEVEE